VGPPFEEGGSSPLVQCLPTGRGLLGAFRIVLLAGGATH
jgi:hypothetical protein